MVSPRKDALAAHAWAVADDDNAVEGPGARMTHDEDLMNRRKAWRWPGRDSACFGRGKREELRSPGANPQASAQSGTLR